MKRVELTALSEGDNFTLANHSFAIEWKRKKNLKTLPLFTF